MNPREAQFYAMNGATDSWKQVANYDDTVEWLHQNSRQRILVVIPDMPCPAAKESCSMTPRSNIIRERKKIFFKHFKSLSHVRLFVTPWTKQSMEFSRPEYWSG